MVGRLQIEVLWVVVAGLPDESSVLLNNASRLAFTFVLRAPPTARHETVIVRTEIFVAAKIQFVSADS